MTDFNDWLVSILSGAGIGLATMVGRLFLRINALERKRDAADVRLEKLEERESPDVSDELRDIDRRLRGLETKIGSGKSTTELWTEFRGLAKSLSKTDQAIAELRGGVEEMRSTVRAMDAYLRSRDG